MTAVLVLVAFLVGCGTDVPDLREWPPNETEEQRNQEMIQAIVRSVRCELRNAVSAAIDTDKGLSLSRDSKRAYADFLYGWGAEVLLTLTIIEKSGVSPSAIGTPPTSPIFTVAGGLGLSAEATRIEKMNFFYTVRELYMPEGQKMQPQRGAERLVMGYKMTLRSQLY